MSTVFTTQSIIDEERTVAVVDVIGGDALAPQIRRAIRTTFGACPTSASVVVTCKPPVGFIAYALQVSASMSKRHSPRWFTMAYVYLNPYGDGEYRDDVARNWADTLAAQLGDATEYRAVLCSGINRERVLRTETLQRVRVSTGRVLEECEVWVAGGPEAARRNDAIVDAEYGGDCLHWVHDPRRCAWVVKKKKERSTTRGTNENG